MLQRIYIFAWVICIACLSSKREKGLWMWVGPNSPPVSTKGHSRAGFCEGGALGYGGMLGYKEEAPGNSGAVGGEPSWGGGFPSLGGLCLTPFA